MAVAIAGGLQRLAAASSPPRSWRPGRREEASMRTDTGCSWRLTPNVLMGSLPCKDHVAASGGQGTLPVFAREHTPGVAATQRDPWSGDRERPHREGPHSPDLHRDGEEPEAGIRQRAEVAQVLGDEDLPPEQEGMDGPLPA